MGNRTRRVAGLLERYQVDRRLPPQVLDLFRETALLRNTAALAARSASARPVVGDSQAEMVVRSGSRRLATAGAMDESLSEIGHRTARTVIAALHARGLEPFVVDRQGDGLVFGVKFEARAAALSALGDELQGPGWFIEWNDGARSGLAALSDATGNRHVKRARQWNVFQALAAGEHLVGQEQGTRITFWQQGTSDQLELVGTRGHERFDERSERTMEHIDGRDYPGVAAFPVAADLAFGDFPIDIVYTWVDGADPDWQSDFRASATTAGRSFDEAALDPARFANRDELRYSLRSIWMYAGWARKIFIVTNGQVPRWLDTSDERVQVVSHDQILPADALPTFNSHAIESALHRIEGLSEHFVYFNDDVLLGRSLRPEAFFTPNGLARVFLSGARIPGVEDDRTQTVDLAARRGRELLMQAYGRVAASKPLHCPFPLRRSVMADVENEFADEVERTRQARFRAPTDLSIASSFAQNVALITGRAVLGDITAGYFHVESDRRKWYLDRIELGRDMDTFCVNETRHTDGDHAERDAQILGFFERYFPVAAPWEIPG